MYHISMVSARQRTRAHRSSGRLSTIRGGGSIRPRSYAL